ncbi:hypothetical protein Q5530_30985 [Saccharothrix sp. BKS2]|uniref:hypothetical protein n=1 Tax=Saccharothrix sp. BKS2 TaxID=3064400 RepID=UPI0039E8C7BF
MTQPQRDRLAAAQAELLRALLAGGSAPPGFAADRVEVERRALLNKRRGIVASLRPEVAAELGNRFRPLFDEYAGQHPRQVGTRFREDAAAFAEWAAARGELSPPPRKRWWRIRSRAT